MSRRRGGRAASGAPEEADNTPVLDRIPPWAAPLVFAVVTLWLFRHFVFTRLMLVGQDTFSLGYVARAFYANALRTTGFPFWNPQILGGTPFIESLAGGDSLYPPSLLLLLVMTTYRALGWKLVLHVFLAGCFMYLWLRVLRRSRGAALVGGLAYLFAPYLVTLVYPGQDGKIFVTALTPLLFAAAEWMMSRRDLASASAVGAVVAAVILTTHFQMAYFLFGATGLYVAFRSVELARGAEGWGFAMRRFGVFLLFSVVGAGAAGVQLIPAVDYVTKYSRRTMTTTETDPAAARAYSASWSLHPEEAMGLVVPEFVGSNAGGAAWTTNTYWGRNAFKLNHEYLGLVALLLAALSFLGAPRRGLRWFLAGLGVFAFLFTLGEHTPVWGILYDVLPGISLFRAPSIAIFLTGFSVATLAGFGVDRGFALIGEKEGRGIVPGLAAAAGVLMLGWILASSGALMSIWEALFNPPLTEQTSAALAADRLFMVRGFLIAALLAGGTAAVWWAMRRRVAAAWVGVGLLALLVSVDEARVDLPFIQTIEAERFLAPDGNNQFLMERAASEEPFRVLSLVQAGQDVTPALHGLELAAGHHPNDLARYRELIGMVGSGMPQNLASFNPNVLGILNVRYIIWPNQELGPFPFEGVDPVSQMQFADGRVYRSVYAYPGLPRARVVGDALVVPEEETLDVVLDPDAYDPATQVVLNEDPPLPLGGPGVQGSATWVERTPNRLALDVTSSGSALLVIGDNWFPAWKATVDGAPVPLLRADHTLRAVPVPEGSHRVELRYRSGLLEGSLGVSVVCVLLLLVFGLGKGVSARINSRKPAPSEASV